jgi:hypothetical protein
MRDIFQTRQQNSINVNKCNLVQGLRFAGSYADLHNEIWGSTPYLSIGFCGFLSILRSRKWDIIKFPKLSLDLNKEYQITYGSIKPEWAPWGSEDAASCILNVGSR